MTALHLLWLPILLSSVAVFIASSLVHMVLPWHKNDVVPLPNEDQFMDTVRPLAIPPGDYMVPRPASRDQLRSPEFAEKMKRGPVMILTVLPNGTMGMGKNLVQWFVFTVVVGVFSAFVAGRALPPGALSRPIFKFAGVTAFIGYSLAQWPFSIWYKRAWSTTINANVDGLIYAALTAGTFAWLWPR